MKKKQHINGMIRENYKRIYTTGIQFLFELRGEAFLSGLVYQFDKPPYIMGGFIYPVSAEDVAEIEENMKFDTHAEIDDADVDKAEKVMLRFFEEGYVLRANVGPGNEMLCVLDGENAPPVWAYTDMGSNPSSPEDVLWYFNIPIDRLYR